MTQTHAENPAENPAKNPHADSLIRIITDYLRHSAYVQNADALRQELIGLINSQKTLGYQATNVLNCGDLAVVRAVMDKKPLPRIRYDLIKFDSAPKEHRIEIFRLITENMQPDYQKAQYFGHQALISQDIEFFDEVVKWAPETTPEQIVWSYNQAQFHNHRDFWIKLLSKMDVASPHTVAFAQRSIKSGRSPRAVAILVAMGLPLRQTVARCKLDPDANIPSWVFRFCDRASSAHGELEIKAKFPSLECVLEMPNEHIPPLLGGLSQKQKKKLASYRSKSGKVPKSLLELEQIANGSLYPPSGGRAGKS
jgi:hypothetical protein